ncbi:MAG: hypothetical protein JEZ02_06340 [Desulfatibacillum sp.]|nr:hypothetical protein [Desulfatibacillum sp.]
MNDSNETLLINANIEIPVEALKTIVARAKEAAGADAKGVYRVDTSDAVNTMISRFLIERDFMDFVSDLSNYKDRS